MTYDADTGVAHLRELYTRLLGPQREPLGPAGTARQIAEGRRLAAAVKALDESLCAGTVPPAPWLIGQATPGDAHRRRGERGHAHAEAYMLMTYVTRDRAESELIWNSRDGVVPFVASLSSGRTAHRHADLAVDRYDPGYLPPPGSLVFADMTRAWAERMATRVYDLYADACDPGMAARLAELGSRGQAIRHFAQQYTGKPGTPVLLQVQPDGTWDLVPPPSPAEIKGE